MSPSGPKDLRHGAEEREGPARPDAARDEDSLRRVHELEVQQVELERQNEALRAARLEVDEGLRRYTELFDFAPIGYLVVGPDGAILDANFAAARLLCVERARLLGRRFQAFVSRRDVAGFERFLREILADGGEEEGALAPCEVVLERAASGTAHLRLTGAVLQALAPSALLGVEDVTARARAEEALRVEARRKDEFLAALSHELRNPLGPIRNALALLARAPRDGEQASRAIAVIDRQVAHLGRIVDGLLDVTRIARGKVCLRRERLELGDLVRRTIEDHRAIFEACGLALDARLPPDTCWVDVDPTRVAQVLGNLLENAAKFTARGGRVEVAVRCDAGIAAVTVRDTGVGIAPDVRDRLFEPFAQAPQAIDRASGGLGLGLATVKGLVELHGGSVGLRSDGPGCGAEFTVRFPLAEGPPEPRRDESRARSRRRRVLVVDDNEDGANTLKEVLELAGHEVRVAFDGPSAVEAARAFRPDLVICDIGLPGMDGYAVARALRDDPATRRARLVALSGYALPDDLRRAREAGFDRHLAKPIGLGTLERLLEEGASRPASPPQLEA